MTQRPITFTVAHVSNAGRIQFRGTQYFDNPHGFQLKEGRVYRLIIDDRKRRIESVIESDRLDTTAENALLSAEINRLTQIIESAGIDPENPSGVYIKVPDNLDDGELEPDLILEDLDTDHNLDSFYQAQMERDVKRETGRPESWIDYIDPRYQLKVRKLMSLKNQRHQDRIKSTGRDIDCEIAYYCDDVPIGLLPDDIRDHIQGQITGGYRA